MGILATDAFGGSGNLDANWTVMTGFNMPQQSSGVCQPFASGAPGSIAVYTAVAWPANQYVSAKIITDVTLASLAICVRSITASRSNYQVDVAGPLDASVVVTLRRYITGTPVTLATANVAISSGDILKLEIIGSDLTAYLNGASILSASDATHSSGSPGVVVYTNSGNVAHCQADDWEGGDFNTGITGLRPASCM